MITFRDVKECLEYLDGAFWIVSGSEEKVLYVNKAGILTVSANLNSLFPLSFDIVLERLKHYNITPQELIEKVEQL